MFISSIRRRLWNMAAPLPLTDVDLARPAKELPLKVIRLLGHMLHRHPPMSGNWEILAEELGYGYDDIKQFATLATVRQEMTPGELLLRDWIEQGVRGGGRGHTIYVLRDALTRMGRHDCVDLMEEEVYNTVIHMELTVCIQDEASQAGTQHLRVRTRIDTCLLNSLQSILQQPLETNYTLLDPGASWTRTLARQYKGRALMLKKIAGVVDEEVGVDQDPTVDSSGMIEDETSGMAPGFTPMPGPMVTRPSMDNCTDPHGQNSGWRKTSRAFPVRQRSVAVRQTKKTPSIQQIRKSFLSEIATNIYRLVADSDTAHNQMLHSLQYCSNHRELNTSDDLPQNDLNINHAVKRPSSSVSGRNGDEISNLHIADPHRMNIHVSERKLDNITTTERSDTECANNVGINRYALESVHIEKTESSDRSVSENFLTVINNIEAMMIEYDDYRKSFDDNAEYSEYIEDLETDGEIDQNPDMGLDKEFVEHKSMPFPTSKSDKDITMLVRNTDGYPYIDLNKHPQTSSTQVDNASLNKKKDVLTEDDVDRNGEVSTSRLSGYESLQRQSSCIEDLHHYTSYKSTANNFLTIADVFSSVTEKQPELIFKHQQESHFVGKSQTKLFPENNANRWQSFSGKTKGNAINANKSNFRHTYAQGQKSSALSLPEKSTETVGASSQNHWDRLLCLETMNNTTIPPSSSNNSIKVKFQPYKVSVRGRSDRPSSLDAAVVGDNLFSFYNNELYREPGWSPLETESTVEGTMRDVLHQDGFYMLWYSRTKRNLMITVSDQGQYVHVRVRSKVHNDHLNFYVVPGVLHRKVHQLLQCCLEQGLSVQPGSTLQGTRGREHGRIWMRCPVVVQYERKPAVNV